LTTLLYRRLLTLFHELKSYVLEKKETVLLAVLRHSLYGKFAEEYQEYKRSPEFIAYLPEVVKIKKKFTMNLFISFLPHHMATCS
jgi:hypothetical protein